MSTKYPSPLLGYNNNVRHKGRVFHIQTEDSGAKYGHIITQLFMDGGRILKSVKTSYSEYLGSERMSEIVREMMKQQHKAMFIALRGGKLDPLADGVEARPSSFAVPAPDQAGGRESATGIPRAPSSPKLAPDSAARPAADYAGERPQAQSWAPDGVEEFASEGDDPDQAPPTVRHPNSSADTKGDVAEIERPAAAAVPAAPPLLRGANGLPPPPARLFREGERRHAPTRPASIFGQARPAQGKSIFGSDLISDKSLDEVILSYLAEDLDEKK